LGQARAKGQRGHENPAQTRATDNAESEITFGERKEKSSGIWPAAHEKHSDGVGKELRTCSGTKTNDLVAVCNIQKKQPGKKEMGKRTQETQRRKKMNRIFE